MKTLFLIAILSQLGRESECFSINNGKQRIQLPTAKLQPSLTQEKDISKNEPFALKSFGKVLIERSNTLESAGFNDPSISEYPPLQAGARTNITLFLLALGYKWYRSIFINKVSEFRII